MHTTTECVFSADPIPSARIAQSQSHPAALPDEPLTIAPLVSIRIKISTHSATNGGVAERFNALVLKTSVT